MKRFSFSKLVIPIIILSAWSSSVFAQTTFPVPNIPGCSGVSGVIVTMRGGGGGTSNSAGTGFPDGGPGGFPGSVTCTLDVITPTVITSLTYYVGLVGGTGVPVLTGTAGIPGGVGYGTGGNGGNFAGPTGGIGTDVPGGGGGGSSAVLNGGVPLFVAGGGGGGGSLMTTLRGGNGGNPGTAGANAGTYNFGGAGGTPGVGGAAGGVGLNYNGSPAGPIPTGNGGNGGEGLTGSQSGGGGGAGWGGGGGGGAGNLAGTGSTIGVNTSTGAGGGGANYVAPTCVTTGLTNGTATVGGNGIVTLTLYPAAIGGTCISLCPGATTTFTETTAGGVWSSSNAIIASVSATTGTPITVTAGTTAGSATISYTEPSGYYAFVVVTVLSAPSPITGPTVLCVGQTINLADALPGGAWTSGTPAVAAVGASSGAVTGVSAGPDIITYTAPGGCPATYSVTVIAQPGPIGGPVALCAESTITLTNTIAGGIWSSTNTSVATIDPTSGVLSGISAGTTDITYSGGATCYVTGIVTVNPLPVITTFPFVSPSTCFGSDGFITLNGLTSGTTYLVDYTFNGTAATTRTLTAAAGEVIITGLSSGTYTNIYVTDAVTGCVSLPVGPVTLVDPPNPPAPVVTSNSPLCDRQTLLLSATDAFGGGVYSWTGPDGFTSSLQNPSIAGATDVNTGTYTVIYTRLNCVSPPGTTDVAMSPPLVLTNVTLSQTIFYGTTIQLNADNAYYYTWTPNDGSLNNPNINDPIAAPLVTTIYTVYGRNLKGCLDSAFVTITVDTTLPAAIPSAFTPNGDGLNDVFRPVGVRFQSLVEFRVYNRWGQEIFYSNNMEHGWDGTYNGAPQGTGVYFYQVIVAQPGGKGKNIVYKGDVTLIR